VGDIDRGRRGDRRCGRLSSSCATHRGAPALIAANQPDGRSYEQDFGRLQRGLPAAPWLVGTEAECWSEQTFPQRRRS